MYLDDACVCGVTENLVHRGNSVSDVPGLHRQAIPGQPPTERISFRERFSLNHGTNWREEDRVGRRPRAQEFACREIRASSKADARLGQANRDIDRNHSCVHCHNSSSVGK